MIGIIKLVFSNFVYVGLAAIVFVTILLTLSSLSEYVFFSPYFVFYIPLDRVFGFALITIVAALASVVVPMNVYQIRMLRKTSGVSMGLFGSIMGASAGACGCGPVGFAVISALGTIGGMTTAFITSYENPIRILSIGVLAYVFYTTTRSLNGCSLNNLKEPPESKMGSHEIGPGKDDSGHSYTE